MVLDDLSGNLVLSICSAVSGGLEDEGVAARLERVQGRDGEGVVFPLAVDNHFLLYVRCKCDDGVAQVLSTGVVDLSRGGDREALRELLAGHRREDADVELTHTGHKSTVVGATEAGQDEEKNRACVHDLRVPAEVVGDTEKIPHVYGRHGAKCGEKSSSHTLIDCGLGSHLSQEHAEMGHAELFIHGPSL